MAIVDVLKKLHKTMTGKDSVGETIEAVIGDLNENYTGGGSSLPDMTGQSGKFLTNNGTAASWGDVSALPEPGANGNVLTSNGTAWGSVAPSSNEFIVTIVAETVETETVYHAEHDGAPITIADIYAQKQMGKKIVAFLPEEEHELQAFHIDGHLALFGYAYCEGDSFIGSIFGYCESNVDTWIVSNMAIPEPSANGKVLGVDGGEYALVDTRYPLILTGAEGEGTAVTVSGATLAEIYEAANAGRYVAVDIPLTALGGVTARLPLIIYNYDSTAEEYSFGFSMAIPVTSNGMLVTITLENSLNGEIEQKTWAVTG